MEVPAAEVFHLLSSIVKQSPRLSCGKVLFPRRNCWRAETQNCHFRFDPYRIALHELRVAHPYRYPLQGGSPVGRAFFRSDRYHAGACHFHVHAHPDKDPDSYDDTHNYAYADKNDGSME